MQAIAPNSQRFFLIPPNSQNPSVFTKFLDQTKNLWRFDNCSWILQTSSFSRQEPTSHFTCGIGSHYKISDNKLHLTSGFPKAINSIVKMLRSCCVQTRKNNNQTWIFMFFHALSNGVGVGWKQLVKHSNVKVFALTSWSTVCKGSVFLQFCGKIQSQGCTNLFLGTDFFGRAILFACLIGHTKNGGSKPKYRSDWDATRRIASCSLLPK